MKFNGRIFQRLFHAENRRLKSQMGAEKNQRESARNKSALICERKRSEK
jgi:hypothetical protein